MSPINAAPTDGALPDCRGEVRKDFENDEKGCSLHLYVQMSQRLPTTKQTMELQFGGNVNEVLGAEVVTLLTDTYSAVAEHCDAFQKASHQVASLANDLISYVRDTEAFDPKVKEDFNIFYHGTDRDTCQEAADDLRRIFSRISDLTGPFPSEVQRCLELSHKFKQDIGNDQRLVSDLSERVGRAKFETEEQFDSIERVIEEKRTALAKLNSECELLLQKCQSVSWYVWIPIVGWIAGSVADQASSKVTSIVNEISRLDKELKGLNIVPSYAARLKATAMQINSQVKDLHTHIAGALDSLTVIVAAWERISHDFELITESLELWKAILQDYYTFQREQKTLAEISRLAHDVAHALVGVSDPTG